MTTTIETPEYLRHHECGADPFTASELHAIFDYLTEIDGIPDYLDSPDAHLWPEDFTRDDVLAAYRGMFSSSSDWYTALDSLKSGLRNPGGGPAHSGAAYRYLREQCNLWYRSLHLLRREACKYAYGTAGAQPEVDAGFLTFGDIPGIELDGTIAAESV